MVNNVSFVTDAHGKFYAGMTLKEAQENGIGIPQLIINETTKSLSSIRPIKETISSR